MPRGPIGGATSALIHTLAEQDVHVSAYQIERWRASGELPRPRRHGLGRGRGVVSEPPDAETVQRALILARLSRRGSRRVGAHPVERVALGLPVPEQVLSRAVYTVLDELAQMTGADVGDDDAGWQFRHDAATRAAHETMYAGWQDLIDAVDGAPARPDPPRGRKRAAVAGVIHALGGGGAALSDDLIETVALFFDLSVEQVEELRRAQRVRELCGDEDPWGSMAEQMSLRNLRRTAQAASHEHLQRALAVVMHVAALQGLIVLLGVLDLAGRSGDLGERLKRYDGAMVRRLQADPMWPWVNTCQLSIKPRHRVRQLVLTAIGLLTAGHLEAWEAYRNRLLQVIKHEPPE